MKECSSISLGLHLSDLFFSGMAKYLTVCARKPSGERKAFLFEVLLPEKGDI